MKYRATLSFLFLLIIFNSCRKRENLVIQAGVEPKSFSEVFEAFWQGMNTNYVYWDIDTTNWNDMYSKYKPLFNHLDFSKYSDHEKAVSYFSEMTCGLTDAHYQIRFTAAPLEGIVINPAASRKLTESFHHQPLSYFALVENFLDSGYVKGYDYQNNQGNGPLFVLSGKIANDILYLGFNEFSLFRSSSSGTANSAKMALQYFFDQVRHNTASLRSIILDVRNNSGGDISDLNFLIGQFISEPLQIGYFRTKIGNNPLDFTPWIGVHIYPPAGAIKIDVPMIALVDNYSASVSEAVALAIREMPKSKIIGEQTYGATGPITGNAVYNAGKFSVGSYLTVETSSAAFKSKDHKIYEGTGLQPDILIPFNIDSISAGIDLALQEAIKF